MENKILKQILRTILAFFVLVCGISIGITYFPKEDKAVSVAEIGQKKNVENVQATPREARISLMQNADTQQQIKERLGDCYIRISKHMTEIFPVQLTDCYQKKQVILYVYNLPQQLFSSEDLELVCAAEKSKWEKTLKKKFQVEYEKADAGRMQATITLQMDAIYGYYLYEDKEYIYIDCRPPAEVYDKIIVLDAGHGGKDTGTYAYLGEWSEKDFNYDFVQRMEKNWDPEKGKLYLTRWTDDKVSLEDRVNFANELEADWFISIHCNSTDEAGGNGLEALYKSNSYGEQSKRMAKLCLNQLVNSTGFDNRGLLDGQEIYIIRKSNMPTVLLEMGFLTDKEDYSYLKEEQNREEMAQALCLAIEEGMESIE